MSNTHAFIAANRFGYGANEKTIQQIKGKPQEWLLNQISDENVAKELRSLNIGWNSQLAAQQLKLYRQQKKQEKNSPADAKPNMMAGSNSTKKAMNRQINKAVNKTVVHSIATPSPFYWHLVDFFSNHFSVSANGTNMRALAPTLEIEAIAPNISGYFTDMLQAVESHPGMLLYLNNEQSIGPNSRIGKRSKGKKGLNENLARETLELHTLGVSAGYDQADVTELARAITGWGVNAKGVSKNGFEFRKALHEPGSRDVFGKIYKAGGMEQGVQILKDLAENPNTAEYVSRKLVRHFISDQPSEALVHEMVNTWLKTKGHLPKVIAVMVQDSSSWLEELQKFKTPREFVISACRTCGIKRLKPDFIKSLTILGQQPFAAGSPAGYKDVQEYWAGPRAMMGRIEWAEHVSKFVKQTPMVLAKHALGPLMQKRTELSISRAESKQQAVTLFLMSPEFQKR
jgi:uncharacterized protein (DUF1800 family)